MGNDSRNFNAKDGNRAGAEVKDTRTAQEMMNEVMMTFMMCSNKPPQQEIKDHGQIRRLTGPAGWEAGQPPTGREHGPSYRELHPAGDKDCQLGFYYRGKRCSEAGAKAFKDVLDKPAHELTPAELRSVREIVRDKANTEDFEVKSAKTEELNGKKTMILEGRYKQNQNDARHLFIDADGTGSSVQEIFFQAPKDKYPKYAPAAEQSIKSIQWK